MRISALAILAMLYATLATAQSAPMSARDIIARVAAKSVTNGKDRNGLMCTKTETVYDASGPQESVKRSEIWNIWYRDGETWQRKISKNGTAIRHPKNEKTTPEFTTTLATLYRYEHADPPRQPDPVSGKECLAIVFNADPDTKPHGIKEEVASRLSGIMYIDPDNFWIRYASGRLEKTYRKFLFVGRLHEMSFTLEQTDEAGAVMPRMVQVRYRFSVLFVKRINERREIIYSDFRPLNPAIITPAPPQ